MGNTLKGNFTGERVLFMEQGAKITDSVFSDGESPLKHSRDIELTNVSFQWKYPLWYSENIRASHCTFYEMGRAGIWYTKNVSLTDCTYIAPKGFRRCENVRLERVHFENAAETLWQCSGVEIISVSAKGDYFGMNSDSVEVDDLSLDGNYCFDGGRDIHVRNSRLMSKDAFWNCSNVTVEGSVISGEYLGWNSKNLTFIDCTIESLQGFCFIENLKLINCRLVNTTLAFEYSTVDAEIRGRVDSVKNPLGGVIRAEEIGELIMEEDKVDTQKTRFILGRAAEESGK